MAEDSEWFEAYDTFVEVTEKGHKDAASIFRNLTGAEEGAKKFCDSEEWAARLKGLHFPPNSGHPGWLATESAGDLDSLAMLPAEWVRLSALESVQLFPQPRPGRPTILGRVFQGRLKNMYFVEALQAIATRPQLVTTMFIDFAANLGFYVVRFFKNGCWTSEYVDDYMPFDAFGGPMCCRSDTFPSPAWPCILEKAYAKLHCSWESIGFGGDVEDALADLTGGVCGRFGVKDVAIDRLFAYLYYWQTESLFVTRLDDAACRSKGVDLAVDAAYAIHRVVFKDHYMFVQLVCGGNIPPSVQEAVPPQVGVDFAETLNDGFFWLRMEDFTAYFSLIIECRLVNSDTGLASLGMGLPDVQRFDEPVKPPWYAAALENRLPGFEGDYYEGPMHEYLFATKARVDQSNAPEFFITVPEVPCEITLCVGQADRRTRLRYQNMRQHAAVLLRVFQRWSGLEKDDMWVFICQSSWRHGRDAMASFKVNIPGQYLALVSLPGQGELASKVCNKMVFRAYTTQQVTIKPRSPQGSHIWVQPDAPVGAIPLSLVGMGNSGPLLEAMKLEEGEGNPVSGNPLDYSHVKLHPDDEKRSTCCIA
mmetsp:Transcript_35334/g.77389  ORF Transcript_35334/g.77389 Transcript_35334/m.77389 type:complete len:591 (-) Transcript_35334:55-1827(-)